MHIINMKICTKYTNTHIKIIKIINVKKIKDVSGFVNLEFAQLLKLLWNSRPGFLDGAVSPVKFKDKIAEFAKRFVGYR